LQLHEVIQHRSRKLEEQQLKYFNSKNTITSFTTTTITNMSTCLHLKVGCNGDLRRFTVFRIYVTLEEIRELFWGLFEDFSQETTIRYLDDENDWVNITNQAEFQEAVRLAPSMKNKTLRMLLENKKEVAPVRDQKVFKKPIRSRLQQGTSGIEQSSQNNLTAKQQVLAGIRNWKGAPKIEPKMEEPRKEEPKKVLSKFECALQELEAIGFTDRKRNVEVLIRYTCDLQRAIDELVSG